MTQTVFHTLGPVFDENSRVLILGTMPSPKSREAGFYYSHPQNRFWRILSELYRAPLPQTNAEKTALVLAHRIALWDVLKSCRIDGADDGSIRDPVPNDIAGIIQIAKIDTIFTTGTKAAALYRRLCRKATGTDAVPLPSTSPANCRRYTYESLLEAYRILWDCTERWENGGSTGV